MSKEKTISNPYGRNSNASYYGSYFNLFYSYVDRHSVQPSIYEYHLPIKASTFEKLEKMGAKRVFLCELEVKDEVKEVEVCYEYEDSMVLIYRKESLIRRLDYVQDVDEVGEDGEEEKDFATYKGRILYGSSSTLERVKACFETESEAKRHSNVHLLCSIDGMLALQRFEIKLPKSINLELNYGKASAEKLEKITELMAKNKNGLVLFSGDPGTGKSTFIKYLTTKTDRKVIYLSSAAAEQLTNPDFLSFIMSHRNCILLLEDAEKVIRSRESSDSGAVSNILNITDGILGDCLNIMIIATFNIERENIDSALVRKGRLLFEHCFKALSAEECNEIFKSIGSEKSTDVPMTLADIYNDEENFHEEKEERKVGF
jgi:adenosyl cobinamide kinase/adenosyl cobinamide phosphate guanylyltransferase